jgi:hypothetical protein
VKNLHSNVVAAIPVPLINKSLPIVDKVTDVAKSDNN